VTKASTALHPGPRANAGASARDRILGAAFAVFMAHGFERASTLDIATRAKVSKRELYAQFDNKQAMLAACIAERSSRMYRPLTMPAPTNRKALEATLKMFGIALMRGISAPQVLAVYRLAIAESDASPEIGRLLDSAGREANRRALIELLADAQAKGLIGEGEPATMAGRFFALMWGDLLIRLLLRVASVPKDEEIEQRALAATQILMALYPAARRKITKR
jgi:AcrR family transcriptional regulator